MATRVEWRTRGETNDVLLVVDEEKGTVSTARDADPELLRDFLNDMEQLDRYGNGSSLKDTNPDAWGQLVMSRSADGRVLMMDPELYWDAIYQWFRSRGVDPHSVRR